MTGGMKKILCVVGLGVCTLFSSCVWVNLSDKLADRCRQREAVIIPGWDKGTSEFYRAGGKLYVKGIRTTFRRSSRQAVAIFVEGPYEHFTPVAGVEQVPVYASVEQLATAKLPTAYDLWKDELPAGARPVKKPKQEEIARIAYTHMGSLDPTVKDGRDPVTALDLEAFRKSSWYVMPAAGLTQLAVDVPGTLICTTASPLIVGLHPRYSFTEPVDCSPYVAEAQR